MREVKKYLGDSLKVTPNFQEFQNRYSIEKKANNRIFNPGWLRLTLYTVFTCLVLAFTIQGIIKIDNYYKENEIHNGFEIVESGKKVFQNLFAKGPEEIDIAKLKELINKSTILKKEDVAVINSIKNNDNKYSIYFVISESCQDVIYIVNNSDPCIYYVFDSNLKYSYINVLVEFESLSQTSLGYSYLYNKRQKFMTTIKVEFVIKNDLKYCLLYQTNIIGEDYTLNID